MQDIVNVHLTNVLITNNSIAQEKRYTRHENVNAASITHKISFSAATLQKVIFINHLDDVRRFLFSVLLLRVISDEMDMQLLVTPFEPLIANKNHALAKFRP